MFNGYYRLAFGITIMMASVNVFGSTNNYSQANNYGYYKCCDQRNNIYWPPLCIPNDYDYTKAPENIQNQTVHTNIVLSTTRRLISKDFELPSYPNKCEAHEARLKPQHAWFC